MITSEPRSGVEPHFARLNKWGIIVTEKGERDKKDELLCC